jgi:hypothetical protein
MRFVPSRKRIASLAEQVDAAILGATQLAASRKNGTKMQIADRMQNDWSLVTSSPAIPLNERLPVSLAFA